MKDDIISLFKQGKLLARAMENPSYTKNYETGKYDLDFSVWATEYEIAKQEGLISLSTTLLVSDESIPTYKAIGYLVNSDNSDVRHIAESDSGSSGNEKDGNFSANKSDIKTLDELQEKIKSEHSNIMNEVNINMRENAYVGLFARKVDNQRLIAQILLAQKTYELQAGVSLPMFIYDSQTGTLDNLDLTLEEKACIIQNCIGNKTLRSSGICYETESGETMSADYLEEIKKDIEKRDSILKSGIEATEETTRIGTINEQVGNIKQITRQKEEKFKGTEIG